MASVSIITTANLDGVTISVVNNKLVASDTSRVPNASVGQPSGVASLDLLGKVPSTQLPTSTDALYGAVRLAAGQASGVLATVASTGSYADLVNHPTAVSEFTNDSGFVNLAQARAGLSVASGAAGYNAATGIISIPTVTSQLSNDSNFITRSAISVTGNGSYNSATGAITVNATAMVSGGASGSLVYQSAASTTTTLPIGSTGQVLTVAGGLPTWAAAATGGTSVTINDDTSTAATYYPLLSTVTSGTATSAKTSSSKLTYNPSTGTLSSVVFNSLSDQRYKTNILPLDNVERVLELLQGYSFDWLDGTGSSYGYLAQELRKLVPHAVSEQDGKLTVNHAALMPFISEGWKRHNERITALEDAVAKLLGE